MRKYSPKNERIKRQYIQHLKEVRGFGDVAIDQFAKAVDRFETYTKHTDFAKFRLEQVRGFKQQLSQQTGARSGEPLSAATPGQQGDLVRNAGKRGAMANPDIQKLMSMVADIHASQNRER
jgi:hypothetical protein